MYYLHAASPDDHALLQMSQLERENEMERLREERALEGTGNRASASPELLGRLNHFRRKPVPGTITRGNTTAGNTTSSKSGNSGVRFSMPPARYQAGQGAGFSGAPSRLSADGAIGVGQEGIGFRDAATASPRLDPSKPNRWSALPDHLYTNTETLNALEGNRNNNNNKLDSFGSIRSRTRPHSAHGVPEAGRSAGMQGQSPFQGTSRNGDQGNADLHITLVRRDPSHGTQWNVATMSSARTDSEVIDIEILTPGYTKFANRNDPLSALGLGLGDNLPPQIREAAAAAAAASSLNNVQPSSRERFKPGRFSRELRASRQQQPQPPPQQQQPSSQQEFPRSSVDTTTRPSLDTLTIPSLTAQYDTTKIKSGYYSFLSPWNGMCTFSTSLNGQSLKCRHVIPGPPSSSSAAAAADTPAITVAELRFNTPLQMVTTTTSSQATITTPVPLMQGPPVQNTLLNDVKETSKRHTLASIFNPGRPRSRSGASLSSVHTAPHQHSSSFGSNGGGGGGSDERLSDEDERDDERLDLSLARENAGGGMKGDEAKLGKLIVSDEGIKMLDLVVAASMMVWWRAYYR